MKIRMVKTVFPKMAPFYRTKDDVAWRRKIYAAEISKCGSTYVHLSRWMMCVAVADYEIV